MVSRPVSKRRTGGDEEEEEEEEQAEYEVDVVPDRLQSSRNSRLALFGSELRLDRFRPRRRRAAVDGEGGFFHDLIILPDNKYAPPRPSIFTYSVRPSVRRRLIGSRPHTAGWLAGLPL
jgi:hypothetical protein